MRFKHSRMHRAPGINKLSRGPAHSKNPTRTQMNLPQHSSNKAFPSDPGDPIEPHHYSPAFWPGKPFLCPDIKHSPGLQVSTISILSSVHFTDTPIDECHTLSMTWMMKIVSIGTKLRHTWKPPMSLKLLIWGSILIQCHNIKGTSHHSGTGTNESRTFSSANTIRARSKRDACETPSSSVIRRRFWELRRCACSDLKWIRELVHSYQL